MQCGATAKSTGMRCRQNARTGYKVCLVHGAGSKKRVKEGKRKDPKTAAVKTGEYTQPETMELKKELDVVYAYCYKQLLEDPKLATIDELAKRLYASVYALDYQELTLDELANRLKSLAFAIARVEQVRTTGNAEFEKQQMQFVDAVKKVFYQFVPREQIAEALAMLKGILGDLGDPSEGEQTEDLALVEPAGSS